MPKNINLTGTAGKKYDLDELKNTNTRTSKDESLVVQIWEWNPNLPGDHGKPNPPSLEIGQIWLSKLVAVDSEEYKKLLENYSPEGGE